MDATATGHWRKVLDGLPAPELFALRDQVADLTKQPGWERVINLIDGGHDRVLKSLTQSATRSHEDYARAIGYLSGLEEAPNVVQAIADAASRRELKLEKEAAVADRATQGETP